MSNMAKVAIIITQYDCILTNFKSNKW